MFTLEEWEDTHGLFIKCKTDKETELSEIESAVEVVPVQVRFMRQGAQGRCTGMTLGDGMGREWGGGFWMGNTCAPVADSCRCMAKNHYSIGKVISFQLK